MAWHSMRYTRWSRLACPMHACNCARRLTLALALTLALSLLTVALTLTLALALALSVKLREARQNAPEYR